MKNCFLLLLCVFITALAQNKTPTFDAVTELTKETLVLANGETVKGSTLLKDKKFIALYFSAHWCGPCRAFTPKLVKFRNKCVQNNLPFEVVFVSSDNSQDDMKKYMTDENMKWPAIPFTSPLRYRIKRQFRVNGIPTLVLLDEKGNIVSNDARWDVHILGSKAYASWQSPQYKPLTYQDAQKYDAEKKNIQTAEGLPLTFSIDYEEVTIEGVIKGAKVGDLVIPEKIQGLPVTTIKPHIFERTDIASISIPKTVTSIGKFTNVSASYIVSSYMPHFTKIVVAKENPNYASKAGILYNKDFTTLIFYPPAREGTSHEVLSSVKTLSNHSFCGNLNLENIILPEGLEDIGDGAFRQCKNLKQISIPNGITTINDEVFNQCSLLEKVILPQTLISIKSHAFYDCIRLTDVAMPATVKTIGRCAFAGCQKLQSFTIPASLTNIEDGAFSGCNNLSSFTVASGNNYFAIEDNVLYNASKTHLLFYSHSKPDTSFKVPDTVTRISGGAFARCQKLTSITLPEGLETLGGGVFISCNGLTSVTIPASVKKISGDDFRYCNNLTSVTFLGKPTYISVTIFNGCRKLETIKTDSKLVKKIIEEKYPNVKVIPLQDNEANDANDAKEVKGKQGNTAKETEREKLLKIIQKMPIKDVRRALRILEASRGNEECSAPHEGRFPIGLIGLIGLVGLVGLVHKSHKPH